MQNAGCQIHPAFFCVNRQSETEPNGDTEFSQFFVQIITNKSVKGVNYITVYKKQSRKRSAYDNN
jgi:hypothetical protein